MNATYHKPPPTVSAFAALLALGLTASAGTYSQNFDDFDDFETDLDDGSVMSGTANIVDNQLELTADGVAGGFASFSVPGIENSSFGWTATFDLTISDSEGDNDPADGLSFNYGNAALGELGSAEEGMAGIASVTENISFEIDTWMNLDAEQGVNIAQKIGGIDSDLEFTNGPILEDGTEVSGEVVVTYDPESGVSFSTTGLLTNAEFEMVDTEFVGDDNYTFIFSARVGGANETVLIDNLVIETVTPADTDGDGLTDSYENANMLDPNDNGENPNNAGVVGDPNQGAAGDPDMDNLTNTQERDLGTDPQKADSDADGLNDDVENNSGTWGGLMATGTDPLDSDSDNDKLLDGVENPDLAYDPANPATQPGTDPNIADSDGDFLKDGDEVIQGRNPTVAEPIEAGYVQNFDGFDDFETELGDGSVMAGTATIVDDKLELTADGVAGGFASFSIPPIADSSLGWTATFELTISDSEGDNEPADGLSFNYGNATLGELGSAEEGMAGIASVTENISFEIDTWMNLDAEQGVNIAEKVSGVDTNLEFTNGPILLDGTEVTGIVEIVYDPDSGVSFSTTGLMTNADFELVPTTFEGDDDYTFVLSARVGGANETVLIDNLVIVIVPPVDADGDGLADAYEIANMLDPNDNGENPNNNGVEGDPNNGAAGDPDMDNLTNIQERDLGTDPQKADSDGDGLNDNVENNTGTWVGIMATGTDPRNTDSDSDSLSDGVENPDLPYDPANPTTQPGTDPNIADTDGDTVSDGTEILLGRDPTVRQAILAGYFQDFDGFADGTTDVGDGSVFAGTARVIGGQLELTRNDVAGGFGSFTIPGFANTQEGWTATFDLTISDGAGANEPADGMSFNYGNFELGELGSAEEGMAGIEAVTENISFEIDTWMNLDAEQGVNIAEKVDGLDTDLAFNNGPILEDGTEVSGPVVIVYDPIVGLSFTTDGLLTNTNEDFMEVETTFVGDEAYNFGISARVGGANETLLIDNLRISIGGPSENFRIVSIERVIVPGVDPAPDTASVTLTWNSRDGKVYTVFAGNGEADDDGLVLDDELDDGVESGGEITSFTESGIPLGTAVRYYRILEQ
ncbi:MAG: hypothetical protein ACI9R3_001370 [Verrucomicrobiales bacterium]|jgi:hypothetical protein